MATLPPDLPPVLPPVRPSAPPTSDWLRPLIVIPIGVAATIGGGFAAFMLVVLLPLVFYGDEDIPQGFDQPFEAFTKVSPMAAGLTAVGLLCLAAALVPVRRRAARVVGTVSVVLAAVTPWVWLVIAYRLAKHWHDLNP